LFSPSFCALFAFAVKYSFLILGFSTRSLNNVRILVVYGHVPSREPRFLNNTLCIDTGCVFGGSLSAYRYPETEIVSVEAEREYYAPVKPLDYDSDTVSHDKAGSAHAVSGGADSPPESQYNKY
jgi:hypothetical protein